MGKLYGRASMRDVKCRVKPMIQVSDVVEVMQSIAPPRYAEEWDNVGLLVGRRSASVDRLFLTIDLTDEVLQEAIDARVEMIIAYHPPIFQPIRTLTDEDFRQRIVLLAAAEGIAIYSPHTALDAAPGGLNDWLAESCGPAEVQALTAPEQLPPGEQCKIVTFCPAGAADQIRRALAATGAGHIGAYEMCSFEIAGTGTFYGGQSTSPAVGRSGRLERVEEVRLEMVCSDAARADAIEALRRAHPYEEPPVEIYRLLGRPDRSIGAGRKVVLERGATAKRLAESIKRHLGVTQMFLATSPHAPKQIRTAGLCAGAGGSLLSAAIAQGCELFLTGEMRHHDVLAAQAAGCTVMLAGHTNTERGYLQVLKRRISAALPGVPVQVSKRDRDPLRAV